MKRLAAILSALMLASPVLADPEVRGWKTADSMGCMMLRECDEGVVEVTNVEEIGTLLAYSDYSVVATEANTTVQNHMFLNDSYMDDPVQFIQTLRHEA